MNWRIWALSALAAVAAFVAAGRSYEVWAEARDATLLPPPGGLVDVGGRRLHLLCKGAARGPTVIMVAGGGTPAVVSYAMQDEIATFAHVCSYDRAGLGWSDPAPHALTFDDQLHDLEMLLHNGRLRGPYVFAPESFGSLIVIAFAAKHPDQTAGIVFLDGVDPRLWFSAMVEQGGAQTDAKNVLLGAAWRLGIVRLAFSSLAPDWVWHLPPVTRDEMIALYSRPSTGYAEALEAYRATPPAERPVLTPAMTGDRPVIALRHGKSSDALSAQFEAGWAASQNRLASMSRRGVVIIATGADHEVAQENPDLAAQCIKHALNGLPVQIETDRDARACSTNNTIR